MTITDTNLRKEVPHGHFSGVQRIYDLANGYCLSLINAPELHFFPYAWEAAVLHTDGKGGPGGLCYDTPLTNDVEVFKTVEETNEFILRAIAWAEADRGEEA